MAVPLLDLRAQHATIRDETVAAVMRIVDAQTFILGDAVVELERAIAALSHTKHAIGCANGTDAILLAMRALDIGRGDEVITTPFTFFATAGTIHNVGATPVFVDIEPKSYNILPAAGGAYFWDERGDHVKALDNGSIERGTPLFIRKRFAELGRDGDAWQSPLRG